MSGLYFVLYCVFQFSTQTRINPRARTDVQFLVELFGVSLKEARARLGAAAGDLLTAAKSVHLELLAKERALATPAPINDGRNKRLVLYQDNDSSPPPAPRLQKSMSADARPTPRRRSLSADLVVIAFDLALAVIVVIRVLLFSFNANETRDCRHNTGSILACP